MCYLIIKSTTDLLPSFENGNFLEWLRSTSLVQNNSVKKGNSDLSTPNLKILIERALEFGQNV